MEMNIQIQKLQLRVHVREKTWERDMGKRREEQGVQG